MTSDMSGYHDPQATGRVAFTADDRAAASSRTAWDAEDVDSPADVEHDRVWQTLLVQLLGRLEAGQAALASPAHRKDPTGAVRVAAALVHEMARFVSARLDPNAVSRPLADTLAAAGRFVTAAEVAAGPAPKRWLGLFGGGAEQAAKRDECLWVLGDLPLVLERFFTLLGTGFRLTRPAVEWVDTSGLFLSELKKALAWVEGTDRPAR